MTETDQHQIINATRNWLASVVIGLNLCPFARHEWEKNRIRYAVINHTDIADCLENVIEECIVLDADESIETTLLIYPHQFQAFEDYLDFLALAEEIMELQDYQGTYQVASFHPGYHFNGEEPDDAANYTNRSPYPMLHILREDSIEQAILNHPDPDGIPRRNIELTRQLGGDKLKALLANCQQGSSAN